MTILRRTLACGLVLLACLISEVPSASARTARSAEAQAAPAFSRPAEFAEVLQELRVDTVAADYVLLIDTSGSMDRAGLYGPVRRSLQLLLDALDPSDHVSLITFDARPTLRYSGTPTAEGGPLERLPAAATGQSTDIGAAISAGLRELERPDAQTVGTMLLFTDGKHEPPAESPYSGTSGPVWRDLANRARALRDRHQVTGYPVELGSGPTDASLLSREFPDVEVLALPPDQLRSFFQRVKQSTRVRKARSVLAADRAGAVVVSWPGRRLTNLKLGRGNGEAVVTFQSTMAHVPLELTGVSLKASGITLRATGLPDRLTLEPGEERSLTLHLTFPPLSRGWSIGRRTVIQSGRLAVAATITSPWDQVLRENLNLPVHAGLIGQVTAVRATGQVGWSGAAVVASALLLLALAGLLRLGRLRRQPRLVGTLTITRGTEVVIDQGLRGRSAKIGKGTLSMPQPRLRGSVKGARRRNEDDERPEHGVKVRARANGRARKGVLWNGDSMDVGSYEISYADEVP